MNNNQEQMKIIINLFDKIVEQENLDNQEIDIKETLIKLIDDFLKKRENLTDEQKQILAKVRSRIIIEFIEF